MSEIVYYIASTLDGFVAHEDGSFDGFAWDDEVVADFVEDQKSFGTVLMGRKTYDVGLQQGITSPYPTMRQIVFSQTMQKSPDPSVELLKGDLVDCVTGIKENSDHPIWLCGGSEIATPLIKAGLIEKMVVKLNPVVFGSGIPLFRHLGKHITLKLNGSKQYTCGIVFLKYDVENSSA